MKYKLRRACGMATVVLLAMALGLFPVSAGAEPVERQVTFVGSGGVRLHAGRLT